MIKYELVKYGLVNPDRTSTYQVYEVINETPIKLAFMQSDGYLGDFLDLPKPDLPNKQWVWSEEKDGQLYNSIEELMENV